MLTNINNGTVSSADFSIAATQTMLLSNNCYETGFDQTFISAMNSIDTSQVDYTINAPIVNQAYSLLAAAGTGVALSDVELGFNLSMPQSQLQTQITQLRTSGLTPSLIEIKRDLLQISSLYSVGLNRVGGGRIQRVSAKHGFCGGLNLATGAVGTAAFSLSWGCLPEPFFAVICPAVGALGVIAGALGIVDMIVC